MKNYIVMIALITGYYNGDLNCPTLKYVEFGVKANSLDEAINKAKAMDTSSLSVYESYGTEEM